MEGYQAGWGEVVWVVLMETELEEDQVLYGHVWQGRMFQEGRPVIEWVEETGKLFVLVVQRAWGKTQG